ncbi:MAG: acetolactate synthase [Rubellimicrobium sp.]|nr:acetolactate synthase [Rubellimicrobium sp.]
MDDILITAGAGRGVVRRIGAALVLALLPGLALAEGVPSGLAVALYDVVVEPDTGLARFRFVAPELRSLDFQAVEGDLPWLCDHVALPEVRDSGWTVAQIVVSLGDREVPFGESDPDALQYFAGFAFDSGACEEVYF